MRVFVTEYISSGALSEWPQSQTLLREGVAMLTAVVADLVRLPDCQVTTTLDHRLRSQGIADSNLVEIEWIDDEQSEHAAFDLLVQAADVTLVIAPETDGVLARRIRHVLDIGGQTANCSPAAVELCGDKWNLFQHLESHRLPTIPTAIADLTCDDPWKQFDSSFVLKPRDGAGSWLTFHIELANPDLWQVARRAYRDAAAGDRGILQPFIDGMSLSAGCVCRSNGRVEVLPVGLQRIDRSTLRYHGGEIPANISTEVRTNIEHLIQRTSATIPGLRGYVGFDLILPEVDPMSPVITEINPRLTTSYVGYRPLVVGNLAEHMLESAFDSEDQSHVSALVPCRQTVVQFDPDGTCHLQSKQAEVVTGRQHS